MAVNKFLQDYFNRRKVFTPSQKARNFFYLKRWKPVEAGEWVVFIPASYTDPVFGSETPWFRQFEATVPKTTPSGVPYYPTVACSCYNGEIAKPCAVHEYQAMVTRLQTANDPRALNFKPLRVREVFYFNVLRLGYFHLVEEDYTKSDGSKAKGKVLKECTSHSPEGSPKCPYCKMGAERHFGDLRYLRAGQGYMDSLASIMHSVESHCTCGGHLYPTRAVCANCGAELGDLEALPETQRESLWKEKILCERCGTEAISKLEYACTKCNNPTPLNFEDTVVKVGVVSSGNFQVLTLKEIGGSYEEFIPQTYGEKALEDYMKISMEPLDFPANVSMTYQQQLEILDVDPELLKEETTNPLED